MGCPCKECQRRHRACHDSCEDYIAWKAGEAEKKLAQYANSAQVYYNDYMRKCINRKILKGRR